MNTGNIKSDTKKSFKTETILKEYIIEEDKNFKYLLNFIILLGSLGFLLVGLSSYIQYDIIPLLKAENIIFFPQGITMCFYGLTGLILSLNQIRILLNSIGEGYNEFNKGNGTLKIFRKGVNGTMSDINITYNLNEILRIN